MLRTDASIRFTAAEVHDLAELGIDVAGARSAADFAAALEPWLQALAETHPDLLRKIAAECAARKPVRKPPEQY